MLEKEEIVEKLKEQYNNIQTINILSQYVYDFQKLFGNYITTDEIIERVKKNIIGDFEFVEEPINGHLDGQYDNINKKVIIYQGANLNSEYLNFILFHELSHAITTKQIDNGKNIMGFSFLERSYGTGLNEATTEWLAIKRNKMYNQKYESGYDIVVEQIQILAQIIDEEKIIHCYLYEPENFKNLLAKYNIDFDRIDMIYKILIHNRRDIYNLSNLKKLDEITNYNLYKECQELIDMYSNAIGDVTNIEDFKRKYKILCSNNESLFKINNIISFRFHTSIYNDVVKLIKYGYKVEEIEKTVKEVRISIPKLNQAKKYNDIISKGKNEAIIQLYQEAMKNEADYKNFAYDNYSMLYDKFSEDGFIPDANCLYDIDRYFIIGKFLSQHPNYDYDEISVEQFTLSNNIHMYVLGTLNGESYTYTLPHTMIEKISNDSFKIFAHSEEITFITNGENITVQSNSDKNLQITSAYYKESQLESFDYKANDTQLPENERKYYKSKYDTVMNRINSKKKESPNIEY